MPPQGCQSLAHLSTSDAATGLSVAGSQPSRLVDKVDHLPSNCLVAVNCYEPFRYSFRYTALIIPTPSVPISPIGHIKHHSTMWVHIDRKPDSKPPKVQIVSRTARNMGKTQFAHDVANASYRGLCEPLCPNAESSAVNFSRYVLQFRYGDGTRVAATNGYRNCCLPPECIPRNPKS